MTPRDVACVVLASGLSERFGKSNKLESPLCGKPVLEHVLETVTAVGFGEVFLVSRSSHSGDFVVVKNETPELGQGHALRIGLNAARTKGWHQVSVVLGDMPLVSSVHVKAVVQNLQSSLSVISKSEGRRMPPAAFCATAIDKILGSETKSTARALFDQLNLLTVPMTVEEALDVDTPEDLVTVEAIIRGRS